MRILIAQWKSGEITAYSSIKNFCELNKEKNYHTVISHISRKKQPYEDDQVKLSRVKVN